MSSSLNPSPGSKEPKTRNWLDLFSFVYRNWLDLPEDVTLMILMKLGAFKILNRAQQVCTLWRSICKEPLMWRTIDMRNLGIYKQRDYDLNKMCRQAIDRSCGQLVEISVEYFCNDNLLNYIADSTCNLRCLRLVQCFRITDEGVSEVAKKLPLLEEIDFTLTRVSPIAVEAIGRNCPVLKSLKFHPSSRYGYYVEASNGVASVIAQTMPQLRHLQLFKILLSNEQLLAILDGCPRLESLDIRQCHDVDLGGSLGTRCAQQIKELRPPDAPCDDYEFGAPLCYERMYLQISWDYEVSRRDDEEYLGSPLGSDEVASIGDDQEFDELCVDFSKYLMEERILDGVEKGLSKGKRKKGKGGKKG